MNINKNTKVNLESSSTYSTYHCSKTSIKNAINLSYTKRIKNRDKKDFATTQQVFDRKTLNTL